MTTHCNYDYVGVCFGYYDNGRALRVNKWITRSQECVCSLLLVAYLLTSTPGWIKRRRTVRCGADTRLMFDVAATVFVICGERACAIESQTALVSAFKL